MNYKFGGDYTKISINGYLNNITENKKEIFHLTGIKNKNMITYIQDSTKFKIKIINSNKVILVRDNPEIIHTFIFHNHKTTSSTYTIKENILNLEINIKVLSLEVSENKIKINYIIPDTNTNYEYLLEMSEKI